MGEFEKAAAFSTLQKFGRKASYHTWSSKLWGIALCIGFFALLALGTTAGRCH
jgi:hypothetical protein